MVQTLEERLAKSLPHGVKLKVHHFSALPTSTDPLFVPVHGAAPEPTELESHFLSASVEHDLGFVQSFAIELLVYTTTNLTTLFVSKADSTGYLHLLGLPKGTPSPIRSVFVEFVTHLIQSKHESARRLVVSLFARAQDQYLFPGSIENEKKHVLDDRALIKWWARILDQALKANDALGGSLNDQSGPDKVHCRANIVVPGCDRHETRGFIPRDQDGQVSSVWQVGDPLKSFGKPADFPERCLIPRFPDDPKARFAIDLDDELPERSGDSNGEVLETVQVDRWRSVRSLAQFWELMSFRQECSAGRLVGFLWAIWEFPDRISKKDPELAKNKGGNGDASLPNSEPSQQPVALSQTEVPPSNDSPVHGLGADVLASQRQEIAPQIQSPAVNPSTGEPVSDPPPVEVVNQSNVPPLVTVTPAQITLTPDAYARCTDVLLTLDYCDLDTAAKSTKTFLDAVAKEGGKEAWGVAITGQKQNEVVGGGAGDSGVPSAGSANNLAGIVRKRPKPEANTLSAGLVRKKPKA